MIQIRIKIVPGIGSSEGKWEVVGFDEFLTRYSPGLCMTIYAGKQFPPLHIINEELKSGGSNMGMSGGCYWKPFALTEAEYAEISEEMLTSPDYDLGYDKSLEDRKTLKKWCGAVISHHNPRKREN